MPEKQSREVVWYGGDGESVGSFPLKRTVNGDYICPKCGKACQYGEGQVDEDRMGNAIYGWWFDCWDCGIGSESTEGSFGAFRD